MVPGLPPSPVQPRGVARRERRQADGIGLLDALRQIGRRVDETRGSLAAAVPAHGDVGRLHGQGPRDAVRLARLQREDQVAGLEVRAAHHVEHRQPDPERPARVDPQERVDRNLGLVARAEAQAAQAHLRPPEEQGKDRPPIRPRQRHVELGEDDIQGPPRVREVAADEELLGGAAVEIDRGRGARLLRRRQVRFGRLRATARVGQGIAERDLQPLSSRQRAGAQVEREAVEARRPIERERFGGLGRRRRRVLGGGLHVAGAEMVRGEHLGIGAPGREQGRSQPVMALLQRVGGQPAHHRVADAVVVRLDLLPPEGGPRPYEVGRAQDPEHALALRLEVGGPVRHRDVDRHARDGHDVEEAPCEPRKAGHAGGDDLIERDLHRAELLVGLGEAHQLLDEVGIAPRLARDHVHAPVPSSGLAADEGAGQLLRVGSRQLADGDLPHLERGVRRQALGEDDLQQGAGLGFFAPVAADEEQRGRIGRAQETFEQGGAVDVAPLEVVDEEHEGPAVRHPHEQLAQRAERAPPQLERVGDVEHRAPGAIHRASDRPLDWGTRRPCGCD